MDLLDHNCGGVVSAVTIAGASNYTADSEGGRERIPDTQEAKAVVHTFSGRISNTHFVIVLHTEMGYAGGETYRYLLSSGIEHVLMSRRDGTEADVRNDSVFAQCPLAEIGRAHV